MYDQKTLQRFWAKVCRDAEEFGATPLARRFGVCNQAIADAANGRKWKHVS